MRAGIDDAVKIVRAQRMTKTAYALGDRRRNEAAGPRLREFHFRPPRAACRSPPSRRPILQMGLPFPRRRSAKTDRHGFAFTSFQFFEFRLGLDRGERHRLFSPASPARCRPCTKLAGLVARDRDKRSFTISAMPTNGEAFIRVIEEGADRRTFIALRLDGGLEVAHAAPIGALVLDELLPGISARFGFHQPVSHPIPLFVQARATRKRRRNFSKVLPSSRRRKTAARRSA